MEPEKFDPIESARTAAHSAIDQDEYYGDARASHRTNLEGTLQEEGAIDQLSAALEVFDEEFNKKLAPLMIVEYAGTVNEWAPDASGPDAVYFLRRKEGKLTPAMAEAFMLPKVYRESSGPGSYFCNTVSAVQCKHSTDSCFVTVQHRFDI